VACCEDRSATWAVCSSSALPESHFDALAIFNQDDEAFFRVHQFDADPVLDCLSLGNDVYLAADLEYRHTARVSENADQLGPRGQQRRWRRRRAHRDRSSRPGKERRRERRPRRQAHPPPPPRPTPPPPP